MYDEEVDALSNVKNRSELLAALRNALEVNTFDFVSISRTWKQVKVF